MKRDMEIIHAILLQINDHEAVGLPAVKPDNFSPEQVAYHVNSLAEAGYITGIPSQSLTHGVPDWIDVRLTWGGHEFIDAARNETVWAKFKQTLADKGGAVPFSFMVEILTAIARKEFGLP